MILQRLTIRRWMILVGGLGLGASYSVNILAARRQNFLEEVSYHARSEAEELTNLTNLQEACRINASDRDDPFVQKLMKVCRIRVAFHAGQKSIFRDAASRPWITPNRVAEVPGNTELFDAMMMVPKIRGPDATFFEDKSLSGHREATGAAD